MTSHWKKRFFKSFFIISSTTSKSVTKYTWDRIHITSSTLKHMNGPNKLTVE